ncbi:LOG family protein, partial [Phenylobacterium sp.]|uniref:LOG family protein n=1 Tax=Phenylobacterium sp. TaxID=1871053 RepID=UPI0026006316
MRRQRQRVESACVFCGSSDEADAEFLAAAGGVGKALADAGIKLVYGGGGVGLMGAVARGAHLAGGEVLGIIPTFLVGKERALEVVEHIIVDNMHERKMLMFQR